MVMVLLCVLGLKVLYSVWVVMMWFMLILILRFGCFGMVIWLFWMCSGLCVRCFLVFC